MSPGVAYCLTWAGVYSVLLAIAPDYKPGRMGAIAAAALICGIAAAVIA